MHKKPSKEEPRREKPHPLLPDTQHDEQARQDFVRTLRGHLAARVSPGNAVVWERRAKPSYLKRHGREPENFREVREVMLEDGYYQFWSALQRNSQEMMWQTVIDPTERQRRALIELSETLKSDAPAGGTLRLDSKLEIPRYHTAYDIHLQPGGYHTDTAENDVSAGVLYEAGLPIYIGGALGPLSDFLGRVLSQYVKATFPDLQVNRILDMGCAVGNSTLPWATLYPDAEIHGIDVAAPCLRYAHARAESLGQRVNFSQQNAEGTDFEDGTFDLVVSHIMLHETSRSALKTILAESRRLLRPGGLMLHLDVPRGKGAFEQFLFNWETYNNNERFARFMTEADLPAMAIEAGFKPEQTMMREVPSGFGEGQTNYSDGDMLWPVIFAERSP